MSAFLLFPLMFPVFPDCEVIGTDKDFNFHRFLKSQYKQGNSPFEFPSLMECSRNRIVSDAVGSDEVIEYGYLPERTDGESWLDCSDNEIAEYLRDQYTICLADGHELILWNTYKVSAHRNPNGTVSFTRRIRLAF